ncbi:iron(III)-siderophore-binding periplasmic protein [Azotobacter vinelandii CA]|uniref:Iron(III)-siderophore-binding periplasmic protein n=1 Tax=Azotobacter vinelandii (strain DJ / ATCC BAA-1303) TaxID=322710 RepID=C1DLD0_AZOVD|nr:ABC transporter substrate-binding protein [Azotobacter vinelandii]ACO81123.1 iron(III)-siderophore-binding periplasmic protein [Azotobacter vinelandii DJ]AGK13459.1 iron(III)-siderophore-binding periplasmic protein [Azotobacter vinelandii CA]WKN21870.1 ABC transporter substrate-binding protein [Azotobacter vinelandii]SFX92892.1 iron complex transport system substrate-binding protein [Azotobacter vinelandii]GLK61068.1 ABC transporter substrate-binding protein [Azotobacter vinelandii]
MRVLFAALLLTLALPAPAAPPQRIAAIDWGLAETLLGLGVTPVAVAQLDGYRRWVGEPALPAGMVDLGLRSEPNLELLAELRPELILIGPPFENARARLERIAPVRSLALSGPDGEAYANARRVARELAGLLGREAAGEALIARVDARLAALRARLAGRQRPPLYMAGFLDARHVRLFGARSLYQGVLERVGLENAWNGRTNRWGFAQVGIERLAERPEATLLYLESLPPHAARLRAASPLWQRLPSVRAGRAHGLSPVWSFGGLPAAERFAGQLEAYLTALPSPDSDSPHP